MLRTIEAKPGESLWLAIERAINATRNQPIGTQVVLVFNDTEVKVYPGSHEYDIEEKYNLTRRISQLKGECI